MKHFPFLTDYFLEKGSGGFRDKRYVHTVYMDQAALDRHKTFTVPLYMMHKYKNIDPTFVCLSAVFAIKQQSPLIKQMD